MPQIEFDCPGCRARLSAPDAGSPVSITCPGCGASVQPPKMGVAPGAFISRMSDRISAAAGVERLEGFSLGDTFSEVFSRHSDEDVERYFTVGGPETTPSLDQVDAGWPRPWVFLRMLLLALLVYFGFDQAWEQYHNPNLLPGLIIVGSFAVPFATLMFFFEFNARRNVSMFQVNKLVVLGGVLSLIFALLLFQVTDFFRLGWLGPSVAPLAEEPGKLLALAFVWNNRRYPYLLNGLLLGAAVGAGFAAFESAGYALRFGLANGSDVMKDTIVVRGLLSPFGHIVWTAMSAGALWRVKRGQPFTLEMTRDPRFLRVFVCAVVLHMIWNSSLSLPFYLKYVILGSVAWVVIFGLVQEGLKELRAEKAAAATATAMVIAAAAAPAT
jgi:RsiW-degrading membrane proteinase PrsW (M82 family)